MTTPSGSNEADKIMARTIEIAKHYQLKYVTTKVLFYTVIETPEVKVFLETHGTNVDALIIEMHKYFSDNEELERSTPSSPDLVRATSLKRIFEFANAQRLAFSRDTLGIADFLLALLTDTALGKDFSSYISQADGQAGSGLLISAIENTPHCVLLLDEVEKAAPEVLTIFLQIMDYGMLTSSTGKTVSFRNAIIIMSSNLGAKDKERHVIGFGNRSSHNEADKVATNEFFAPEFRNRLDMAVTFNKLDKSVLTLIINKFIKETNVLLKDKDVSIVLDDKVRDRFVAEVVKENLGARPLNAMIAREIKQPLSKMILFGDVKPGSKLLVDEEDGKIVFNTIIENDMVIV